MGRGNRQRAPKSLVVGHAVGHQRRMLGERGDGRKAPTHIQRGNERGGQEAHQEKEQSDPSEAIDHAIGSKGRDSDGQEERFGALPKRNQSNAHGLTSTERRKAEGWTRNGG